MKKKIICTILAVTMIMSVSACGGQPQSNVQNQQTTVQTTEEITEVELTYEELLMQLAEFYIGCPLDDVKKEFEDSELAHIFACKSDDGSSIMLDKNWAVTDYYISDDKIVFICTKYRNDGIIDAISENSDKIANAIEIIKALKD